MDEKSQADFTFEDFPVSYSSEKDGALSRSGHAPGM